MLDWIQNNETLVGWLIGASVVCFVGTLVVVPIALARIPQDYFVAQRRHRTKEQHPAVRIALGIGRNVLGVILILGGIAMLILPGQGLLTIVIGLLVMDFPGKYRLERWLVRRPRILRGINWIRRKAQRPPLTAPSP